jgi:hypothetical protein
MKKEDGCKENKLIHQLYLNTEDKSMLHLKYKKPVLMLAFPTTCTAKQYDGWFRCFFPRHSKRKETAAKRFITIPN